MADNENIKGNIIIVDDNISNLNLLQTMLKKKGFEVRPFPNGKLALKAVQNDPPDIILLDINMPEMNGYDVCSYLKSQNAFKDIPVIFLSASTEAFNKIKAFEVGGADYISKPFNFEEVHARVFAHLKLRKYQLELELKNAQLQKTLLELEAAAIKLEKISNTDYLTNILNKRGMVQKIEDEAVRYERDKTLFSLIMGDLDFFKDVNDTYGHECGDFILIQMAEILKSTVREQDQVSRWGGEEFLLMLIGTDYDGGVILAEKLRKKVESASFVYKDKIIPITITFGVAEYDRNIGIDDSIKNADMALYRGKITGRNRTMGFYKDVIKRIKER